MSQSTLSDSEELRRAVTVALSSICFIHLTSKNLQELLPPLIKVSVVSVSTLTTVVFMKLKMSVILTV